MPSDFPDTGRLGSRWSQVTGSDGNLREANSTSLTVGFINGLAFHNALRYNGKKAVLLAYPGEGVPYLKKDASREPAKH